MLKCLRVLDCAFAALLMAACPAAAVETAEPSRLGLGVTYLGGELIWRATPKYRYELRAVTGKAESSAGRVTSRVFGARAVRSWRTEAVWRPYLGAEADYVTASLPGGAYRVTGPAFGGFGGVERRLARRLWLSLDAGPYVFVLRERATNLSDTSVEFVANMALVWYVF